jgi:hypothetical protein
MVASTQVGDVARTGLGAGLASRSAATLAAGAAIFRELRATRPAAWQRKAFHRWVEAIRVHLEPVVSLDVLIASFEREAVRLDDSGQEPFMLVGDRLLVSPLLAAYVIRWLELRDDDLLDPWRTLVG